MRPGPASSGPSPDRRPLPPLAREPLAESPPPPSVEPRVVRTRTVRPTGDDGAQGNRGGDAMPGRFFDDGGAETPSPSEQAPVAPSGAS
jgi:hypothetical protein